MRSVAEARKWVVLGALVLTALVAGSSYGEEHSPCEQAYLESGFTRQQMGFEEFREIYSGTLCGPRGDVAHRSGSRVGETASQTPRGRE